MFEQVIRSKLEGCLWWIIFLFFTYCSTFKIAIFSSNSLLFHSSTVHHSFKYGLTLTLGNCFLVSLNFLLLLWSCWKMYNFPLALQAFFIIILIRVAEYTFGVLIYKAKWKVRTSSPVCTAGKSDWNMLVLVVLELLCKSFFLHGMSLQSKCYCALYSGSKGCHQ